MVIGVLNPVGEVAENKSAQVQASILDSLERKAVGFVCNHHPAITEIWTQLERSIEHDLQPSAVRRISKANISMPQPVAELARFASEVDYVVVGVGA